MGLSAAFHLVLFQYEEIFKCFKGNHHYHTNIQNEKGQRNNEGQYLKKGYIQESSLCARMKACVYFTALGSIVIKSLSICLKKGLTEKLTTLS